MMTKDKQFKIEPGARVYVPNQEGTRLYPIPNSRSFVAESLLILLESYLLPGQTRVDFDYRIMRGQSKEDMTWLHDEIRGMLDAELILSVDEPVLSEVTALKIRKYLLAFNRTFYDGD